MAFRYKKRKAIELILFLIFIASIVFLNKDLDTTYILAWGVIGIGIVNVFRSYKNWNTFIISAFLLWCNYSVCVSNILWPIEDSSYTAFRQDSIIVPGINILFVFNVGFTLLLPKIKEMDEDFFERSRKNEIIYYGTAIVLAYILIFKFERPEFGGRGTPSTIYEYSIILFIVALQFSKGKCYLYKTLMILFAVQNMIYGGRVTALQMMIAYFLIFWGHKARKRIVIPVAIVGVAILSIVGELRGARTLSIDTFMVGIDALAQRRLALDTAYAAFFASLCIAKLETMVTFAEKIKQAVLFGANLVFGQSLIGNYNLSNYSQQYFRHSGGGFLPFYFHFYAGWLGVFLLLLFFSWFLNKIYKKEATTNKLTSCVKIYFACTIPRWYLYSPQPIFRGLIILIIVFFVYDIAHQILTGKSPVIKIRMSDNYQKII